MLDSNDKAKLAQMEESGLFDRLLEDIRVDLANELIKTKPDQKDQREVLYMQIVGLDRFNMKLQECVNEFIK